MLQATILPSVVSPIPCAPTATALKLVPGWTKGMSSMPHAVTTPACPARACASPASSAAQTNASKSALAAFLLLLRLR